MVEIAALVKYGCALYLTGKFEAARQKFLTALQEEPYNVTVLHHLGLIATQFGEHSQSIAYLKSAATVETSRADIQADLGVVYRALGDLGRAERHLRQSVTLEPENADFHYNLGLILSDQNKVAEAETVYQEAIFLSPELSSAHNNLGNIKKRTGRFVEALKDYRRATEIDPNFAPAQRNLADVHEMLGNLEEAEKAFTVALNIRPDAATRLRNALLLPVIPDSQDQIIEYRERMMTKLDQILEEGLSLEDPVHQVGATNFMLAYHGMNDRDLQRKIADIYRMACPALSFEASHCQKRGIGLEGRRIRIGFVSSFFFEHTVARLMEGLIAGIPNRTFEVIVYSTCQANNVISSGIKRTAEKFVMLAGSLANAHEVIARDELDILYFCDIGMEPFSYFLAFARLAPVQCVTWGHPVTTGISTIDYFISSSLTEPANGGEAYTERLIQLDGFVTPIADPSNRSLEDNVSEYAKTQRILCPQSLFKFHPTFDALIGKILKHSPNTELILLHGSHDAWTARIEARFRRSIPEVLDRVKLEPRTNRVSFMQSIASSQLVLDTSHFCGGLTTYEALAMETPVVTLPGDYLRSRVSLGLYHKMGLNDCIASDEVEYIDIAVRLLKDARFKTAVCNGIHKLKHGIFCIQESVDQHAVFFQNVMLGNEA